RDELRLDRRGGVGPTVLLRGRVQLALVALKVFGTYVRESNALRGEAGEEIPHVAHIVLGRPFGVARLHVLRETAEEPLIGHGHAALLVSLAKWRSSMKWLSRDRDSPAIAFLAEVAKGRSSAVAHASSPEEGAEIGRRQKSRSLALARLAA